MLNNKRGGVSISIVLLVIFTLVLVISSLTYFTTRSSGITKNLGNSFILERVNINVEEINFNIQNIVDRSFENSNSKEEFIDNFKLELEKYVIDGKFIIPELSQLESQLNSDSVVFSDKGVEVSFEIKVQDKVGNEFLVDYKYTKTFINKHPVS